MAFIRIKTVKKWEYEYLVESYRCKETGKVRQRVLKYIGKKPLLTNLDDDKDKTTTTD